MGACLARIGWAYTPLAHGSSRNNRGRGLRRCGFRNEPLKKERRPSSERGAVTIRPSWTGGGDERITSEAQLGSKRDEFWHTAPAFEGRKEIWDALRAAASALEGNDLELAQAIVDGACITLPHGTLAECYDELGNRYQIPGYCLAPPPAHTAKLIPEPGDKDQSDDRPKRPAKEAPKKEFRLKVRLSTAKDVLLSASMTDTIGELKTQLQAQEGIGASHQRWYFFGKLLTDESRLQDTKFQKDFVIQVIIVNTTGAL